MEFRMRPDVLLPRSTTKISNVTNSNDPAAVNSRVFVGNLNTFVLTKDNVEQIFLRYGRIIGISMHKGYAFVQYTNELNARNCVAGEDQRIYAGQPIDVNISSEPKPNRPSRKRPQGAGAEWDYYYNAPLRVPLPPPMKRPRPDLAPPPGLPLMKRTLVPVGRTHMGPIRPTLIPKPRIEVNPQPVSLQGDIAICGSCKQMFGDAEQLLAHKQSRCLDCTSCNGTSTSTVKAASEPAVLTCATCNKDFTSCWELCKHCQEEHGLNIFTDPKNNNNNNGENTSTTTNSDVGDVLQENNNHEMPEEEEITDDVLASPEVVDQGEENKMD